jgi:hypothetical protein
METFLAIVAVISGLCVIGNFCIMLYGFKKFIDKPRDSMRDELVALRTEVNLIKTQALRDKEEVNARLEKGNKKFDELGELCGVLVRCNLALVEFEIQYCITEDKAMSSDLTEVKKELNNYLSHI